METPLRNCLRDPIPEIYDAARYLDAAVSAHLGGKTHLAEELIGLADMESVRDWVESIWGPGKSHYVVWSEVEASPPNLPIDQRVPVRMPNAAEKRELHGRDGFHCRFCGIPLIRKEIRVRLKELYPQTLYWGGTNATQHPAFQAMWLQYDHLLPHARGGNNDLDNIVLTCGPCNFSRSDYLIEEVGLSDPRERDPVRSTWDGLERLLVASA